MLLIHGSLPLLRARRERPRHSRAAENRDELAPLHSITSSASASSLSGILRPSAFAVLRLITNANLMKMSPGELDHPAAHTRIARFGKPPLASFGSALVRCTR